MNINKYFLIVVFLIIYQVKSDGQNDPEIRLDKEQLKITNKELIKFGEQKRIESGLFSMDVGYGNVQNILFEIPQFKEKRMKRIRFSSVVKKNEFYYPIYIQLDSNYEVLKISKDMVDLSGGYLFSLEDRTDIQIDKETKFILLTTDSSLFSKGFEFLEKSQNMTSIYSGSTLVYVPTTYSYTSRDIKFSDEPIIRVIAPTNRGSNNPIKREQGVYFGIAVSFGGDKVANNPSGDDYRAGGGAIFNLGYSQVLFSSNFVGRLGFGYRHQGSKDGNAVNRGFLGEAVITYQTRYINIGLGGHMDMSNSIRNLNGEKFDFVDRIGPKVITEYRFGGLGNLGLEYVFMDYETTKGVAYGGNRFHITMKFFLGN
ncbi:MAG: hypothetical protein RLO12_01535 [Fulvivirga sp.]